MPPTACDVRRPRRTLPLLDARAPLRARRRARAPARAADRRAAGLRRAGPDAHRHGRQRARAQRVRVRRRRARALRARRSRSARTALPRSRSRLRVRVSDSGPGHPARSHAVLEGRYVSRTGMGLGLAGARRLADRFDVEYDARRAARTVEIARVAAAAPRRGADARDAARLVGDAAQQRARGRARGGAASRTRSCCAHARRAARAAGGDRAAEPELERDQPRRARALRGARRPRAGPQARVGVRSRASCRDVSHELRTPLTSVLNISRLLLDRVGRRAERGAGAPGRRSSSGRWSRSPRSVNDLLDLAKIEAGRTTMRAARRSRSAELFAGAARDVPPAARVATR